MTPDQIRAAVMLKFTSPTWTRTVVAWPNKTFAMPANTGTLDQKSWIRPVVKLAGVDELEVGRTGLSVRSGVLMVQVFTPLDSGAAQGNGLAAAIEAIFRRASIGGIDFGEPSTAEIGDDGQGWYMHTVTAPFTAYVGE